MVACVACRLPTWRVGCSSSSPIGHASCRPASPWQAACRYEWDRATCGVTEGGLPPLGAPRAPSGTSPARASPRSGEAVALRVWVSALVAPCLQRHQPTALLSALGAGCRSSECHGVGAGPRQAQHHRRRAGERLPRPAAHPGCRQPTWTRCCSAPSCPRRCSKAFFQPSPPCRGATDPTGATAGIDLSLGVVRSRSTLAPPTPSSHRTPPQLTQPLLGPPRDPAANSTRATDLGGDPT